MSEQPMRITGWMKFKNESTGEYINSPAIATMIERVLAPKWGAKPVPPTRVILTMRSPVSDAHGDWDTVKHHAIASGLLDEARQWTPFRFTPNDPSFAKLVVDEITACLNQNPQEAAKKKTAEMRSGAMRFDEWHKGWSQDLLWDPFMGLQHTPDVLIYFQEKNLIPVEDEAHLEYWLNQHVSRETKRSFPKKDGQSRSQAPAPAPSTQAPAPAPSTQAPVPAPSAQAPAPAPAAQAPAPAPAAQAPAPAPVAQAPAPAPVAQAPAPAPSVQAPAPAPSVQAPVPTPADQAPREPDEPNSLFALEKSIFGSDEMPAFSAIAQKNGKTLTHQNSERPIQESSPAQHGERHEPHSQPPISISFARFPRHTDEGTVSWDSALLCVGGFLDDFAFNIAKRHRRATRSMANGRTENLYGIGMLRDFAHACIDFTLEGKPIPQAYFKGDAAKPAFDVENCALHAMSKCDFPPAANIASLARAKFFRDKTMSLAKQAQKAPHAPIPTDGWIQMSPGADRANATCVHPEDGLVRWSASAEIGSAQTICVQLTHDKDREALADSARRYLNAKQACQSAAPESDGPTRPDTMPIETLPAFAPRRMASGAPK